MSSIDFQSKQFMQKAFQFQKQKIYVFVELQIHFASGNFFKDF